MNYAEIKYCDIANGEGVRTTLFVSGCRHHCKNCFQPETWSFSYGNEFDSGIEQKILESLKGPFVDGITLLGGEPMEPENQRALLPFLRNVKQAYPNKTVWCYTGDVFEDLQDKNSNRHTEATDELLSLIDVLVDGPYVEAEHDISLRFRGSRNQRIIDVPSTLASGVVCLWNDDSNYATHTWVESGVAI